MKMESPFTALVDRIIIEDSLGRSVGVVLEREIHRHEVRYELARRRAKLSRVHMMRSGESASGRLFDVLIVHTLFDRCATAHDRAWFKDLVTPRVKPGGEVVIV